MRHPYLIALVGLALATSACFGSFSPEGAKRCAETCAAAGLRVYDYGKGAFYGDRCWCDDRRYPDTTPTICRLGGQ